MSQSENSHLVGVWMEDCRPLRAFYLSSVSGRSPEDACWSSLWVPTDWWLWAHVVVPLVAKESTCNQEDPWASMQKTKGDKMGVATPDTLSTRCACPPHGGCLPGRPSQDSPAQCSKWRHWHCPTHWKRWTSGGALGWDQPSRAHRGEELLVPASCRTRCGPSPICCRGAPGAHPGPSEGPHCPRWFEESGSSPSFPSKSPCTICSNSLHVSHPSLSGPFPRGWHCSKPSHIPCALRRHGACLQDSSSSCSLSHRRSHSDGWFAFRLVVLSIVPLNGDEWSRGVAALPCSRVRMTAISWFLPRSFAPWAVRFTCPPKGFRFMASMAGAEQPSLA